jgi:hypothetical protein
MANDPRVLGLLEDMLGVRPGQLRACDAGGVHADERLARRRGGERCVLVHHLFGAAAG